ncbi:MAG TPA: acyl-CoA thioesterase, partial [Albitalea sp.]|nr:acyl-CoA thioesterase [Albitalea sp.]
MTPRAQPDRRESYRHFTNLTTRWMDNDVYGHLNNVVYYSLFDTAVNGYLVGAGALDIQRSEVIGLVIETHCNYFAPIGFPTRIDAGLRV